MAFPKQRYKERAAVNWEQKKVVITIRATLWNCWWNTDSICEQYEIIIKKSVTDEGAIVLFRISCMFQGIPLRFESHVL